MTTVDFSPTIVEELQAENYRLTCAEDEKRIALEVVQQQQQRVSSLEAELEYTKLEANRAKSDAQEARREIRELQERINSVLAICAVPHDQVGPYSKLALITAPAQVPYSAALHGGDPEVMLTSMRQWNKAIGGMPGKDGRENTNTISKALKPLEGTGTVIKKSVECNDGRTHVAIEVNEQHLRHPRFINPDVPRPHNGGDKGKCPGCKGDLKRNIQVTYECPNCGIDYDRDMNPINHHFPIVQAEEAPKPDNVVEFVPRELPMDVDPAASYFANDMAEDDIPWKKASR